MFLCFQDSRQKIGLQNYGWPWQTHPLCCHTHLRNHNNFLKLPSFTPKKIHLVQEDSFEACFWCHICVFPLRPRLWSKEVHGLTYRETRYEVQRIQRSIQRVPMCLKPGGQIDVCVVEFVQGTFLSMFPAGAGAVVFLGGETGVDS